MIKIDNKLISETLFTEYFVCDISNCKGNCCEEGDVGAPILEDEKEHIKRLFPLIQDELDDKAQTVIAQKGLFTYDKDFGWVTPTVGKGICVYGKRSENGCINCLFQKQFRKQKNDWEKPISCHLYPIRVKQTKTYELLNFEPREQLCKSSCHFGQQKQIKVFQFLRAPLIRAYGEHFFQLLENVNTTYFTD